ncbi:MAG TPA: hypothetical protein PLQ34_09705 [Ferrovaceae bacterium]|nr:hypothetical protein [Ferrovaceae bacterium]
MSKSLTLFHNCRTMLEVATTSKEEAGSVALQYVLLPVSPVEGYL